MYDCRELGFGIEIEFTRISRFEAAKAVAACLGTTATQSGGWGSDNYEVRDGQQRAWRIVKDNSITPQRMDNRTLQITSEDYQCELVSPKFTYDDLSLLQKLVRELR